jgi:hypothetical protein
MAQGEVSGVKRKGRTTVNSRQRASDILNFRFMKEAMGNHPRGDPQSNFSIGKSRRPYIFIPSSPKSSSSLLAKLLTTVSNSIDLGNSL